MSLTHTKILSITAAALLFSAVTQASNTGVIRFVGSVTDTTCNIVPIDAGGVVNHDIDLGTVIAADLTDANPSSNVVQFSLAPSSGSPPECTDGSKTVEVGFSSDYNAVGLVNTGGSAGNASIKLEGQKAGGWHAYTVNDQTVELTSEPATGAIKFRAAMTKTASGVAVTSGTVMSQATYSVVYK